MRLLWGLALAWLLLGLGGAALSTGDAVWIAAFALVLSIAAIQLVSAGPAKGRLWDSWLTRAIYVSVGTFGIYFFGEPAIETGDATAVVPLIALIGLIGLQWARYLGGRGKRPT